MTTYATAPSKRTLGLDPSVAFSLAGALAFFVISAAVSWYNVQTLRSNNERVVHSHEVIVGLSDLLSLIQDAETGQRGFVLTNSERYLEPYNAAITAIPKRVETIGDMISDNASQQQRLAMLRSHVDAKLSELRESIDLRRTQGVDAALAVVNSDRGKAEMDAVRAQLTSMRQEEARLRAQRLAEMESAYTTAFASSILAGLLGILLTLAIAALMRQSTLSRRRQDWLQAGEVGLNAAVTGDRRIEELGDNILEFLARYTGAVAGAIFVQGEDEFELASTWGVRENASVPDRFKPREGLLGQAVSGAKPILVSDVPDGYLTFGSALGTNKPKHLLISPGGVDGAVNSVIELGFLRAIDEKILTLLDQASASIATAVRSAKYRSDLQNLLRETQRQAEELQVQGEELRVSNEELEEQGRALKESQARLEQQQVELEQTNSQLEEQAQQLEGQRDDLEKVNASVQLKARELEQASRYKSDFLANMSHELRTPLNSSLILAKLLADNPDDNLTQEQVKYAQTIQSSGNDLLTLINDILDLSKIEAGHVDITPEPVSLERMAGSIRQLFDPVARSKELEFDIEMTPEAPAVIETDPQRLEQVIKNLLSNAFKFTEKGKVTLALRSAGDGQLALAVSDTGIGIAEEQQNSIFEAFHQADGTISRRFGGTGLGLSISRELVRLLGGTIHLTSRHGQGSTFTVIVPVSYDPSRVLPRNIRTAETIAAPRPVVEEARPSSISRHEIVEDDRAAPSDGRRTLLVIEDDDTFSAILRDLAREMGFRALVAGTAYDALDLARQHMPSAIVLDVGLPDQSGLSVLDRLKRDVRTRHIPIHIVSADDYAETALSLGAVGYVMKPVQREQLVEVLQKLDAKLSQGVHRVLIVEDNEVQRQAVAKLLTSHDVETIGAGTAAECLTLLKEQTFDCMVLDLSLPDASGYQLLETISADSSHSFPPVIVYTGRVLSADEEQRLRRYSKSIIIKGAKSPERLLDEVSLFLHQVVSDLPDEQQKMIRKARSRDALLEGRRILIVEDDVRNVYALTNILEPRGAVIEIARNGQEALDKLGQSQGDAAKAIDLVLMDVMMPVMDGLTATRTIRRNPDWKKLPIITLTAKAMPDDQQRCIEAGANDYMAKPLDVEKLLSLRTCVDAAVIETFEKVEDIEIRLLLEALHVRYHYDFRNYAMGSIKRRLRQARDQMGFATISALQERVLHDETMLPRLLGYLTVQVSEMFRDPGYFRAIREDVVPHLRTYPSLKIWVAGCSCGEELYSLAILFREEGLEDRTIFYATDINQDALRMAEAGVYELDRIQLFTENHRKSGGKSSLSDYYSAGYGRVSFDRTLRERVVFSDHSLVTDAVFGEMHLISCRNVMIYFDRPLQDRAVGLFKESLARKGFLGIGAKESLRFSAHGEEFKEFVREEKIYQRVSR